MVDASTERPTTADTDDDGRVEASATIDGPLLGRKNYLLLLTALGVIVTGFVVLSTGDITVAPILLVVGYLVLVPVALLKR